MTNARDPAVESPYAWLRLGVALLMGTIGGVGLWSFVVALPVIQAEFQVTRAEASLPYTWGMLGLMLGGIVMGRLSDRLRIFLPALLGSVMLGIGYLLLAGAESLIGFTIIYAVAICAVGSAALFSPLVADTSLWFDRRRGIAVALVASGNYFAGTIWPPILQPAMEAWGWRTTSLGIGLFCLVTLVPLAFVLRRPAPVTPQPRAMTASATREAARPLGLPPNALQALLMFAGVACCIAMSMPQVHIVAYCTDLGYGAARGAEMLSLMLLTGTISRLLFGLVMDRIGGTGTLLLGSVLQMVALALFLPFDGLASLYVISALFGLFQGGIIPSYAMIVREVFPAQQAGTRVSLALSATLAGMAIGGWMSGAIFDLTGTYRAAVLNGIAWNAVNLAIAAWLFLRVRQRLAYA
ncbi:MAG TPA: MFS transporter [Acetobacteraceae bacterium]|nr:MFS transporter [Acetobacteraceae bacterium]